MAKVSYKLSIIFTILLLVSLLSVGSVAHARKLLMNFQPNNNEPAFGETTAGGEGGSRAMQHETSTRSLGVTLHVLAMTESTTPGHSPGVGHLTSKTEDFKPTEPGHSPGVGHSIGPEAVTSPGHHH
ncbi:hypothetical protein SAY87_021579 [Trapa incisa]|uniref:Uncharacterized protein n=1 Tax=Trapa incisa TaxID=236973 RepID=A0AAN7JRX4_9MYRT|nr:hypothetical protein SAY87_021579 [Trapa incisa]